MIKFTRLIIFSIALIISNNLMGWSQTAQTPFAVTCKPYLQNLHQNGITIMWMVNNNAASWVDYGTTEQLGERAIHSQSGMIDVNPGIQKIVLKGLEPGTRYFYRAASREVKLHQAYNVVYGDTVFSDTYSFTTPSASTQQFSFLAFNDLHSKPQFINEVMMRENGFSFAMMNGDILSDINSEEEISNNLLIPFSKFFATGKPFFLTRGNHETRGPGARLLSKYIDTPTGNFYYSFTYGNTCFIVLDCGEDKPDGNKEYYGLADYDKYRMDEAEWLALEVQKPAFKNADYRIVCIHFPVTMNKAAASIAGHGMADCSKKFGSILNEARVDLMLSGHTHRFRVIRPQEGITTFPIIVGGGPYNEKDPGRTTYTFVEVSKDGINCFLKKANGEIIEEVKVTRK